MLELVDKTSDTLLAEKDSMSQDIHQPARTSGEPFFVAIGLLLTAIVVAGFGASVTSISDGVSSLPALYHAHGIIFLSWFLLFTLQALFARQGKLRVHRTLGQLSLLLAFAMLVSGYFMIRAAYHDADFRIGTNSHDASMMFPVTDLVNFSIVFGLGLYHRAKAVSHKRLMLLAGILILDPAMARLVAAIGAPFMVIPLLELGLFLMLFGYDVARLRRLHWASMLGLGLWLAALLAKLLLAEQPSWSALAARLFS